MLQLTVPYTISGLLGEDCVASFCNVNGVYCAKYLSQHWSGGIQHYLNSERIVQIFLLSSIQKYLKFQNLKKKKQSYKSQNFDQYLKRIVNKTILQICSHHCLSTARNTFCTTFLVKCHAGTQLDVKCFYVASCPTSPIQVSNIGTSFWFCA